ncbi:hypothetical protein GGF31_001565 [Allomyces arbusculus]|nr:hypothetical protein GGF31_001565 [Allomyces arbusculus]
MNTNHPPSLWSWPPAPAGPLPLPLPAVPVPVTISVPGTGSPALATAASGPATTTTAAASSSNALADSANATVLIAVRVRPSDPAVHVCEPVVLTPRGAMIPLQALLEDKAHTLPPSAITLLHLLSAVPLQLVDAVRAMGAAHVVDPAMGKWFEPYLRLERPSAPPTSPNALWPMQVPGLWPAPGSPSASMPGLPPMPGRLSVPAMTLPITVPGTLTFLPTGNDYMSSLHAQLQAVQGVPPGPAAVPAPAPSMAPSALTTTAAAPAPLQPPSMRVSPPVHEPPPKRVLTGTSERAPTPRAPELAPTPRAPERAPTPRAPERVPTAKTIAKERVGPTSILSRIRDPKDAARPPPHSVTPPQKRALSPSPPAAGGSGGAQKRPAPAREVVGPEAEEPVPAVAVAIACGRESGALAVAVPLTSAAPVTIPVSFAPQAPAAVVLARPALVAVCALARRVPAMVAVPVAIPVPIAALVPVAVSVAATRLARHTPFDAPDSVHSPEPAAIPAPISAPAPVPAPIPALPSSSAPTDLRALLKSQRTSFKFIARVFPPSKPLPERWLEKVRLALSFFVTGGVHAVHWTARDVFTFEVKSLSRIVDRIMELSTMTISGHWVTLTPEDPADLPTDPVLLQRLQVPRALYVLANLPVTRLLTDLRDFIEARGIEGRLDMVGSPFPNCAWRYGYFTLARECTVEPTVFDGVEFMGRRMVVRRIENPEQFFAVDNMRPLLDAIVPLCDNQW